MNRILLVSFDTDKKILIVGEKNFQNKEVTILNSMQGDKAESLYENLLSKGDKE